MYSLILDHKIIVRVFILVRGLKLFLLWVEKSNMKNTLQTGLDLLEYKGLLRGVLRFKLVRLQY